MSSQTFTTDEKGDIREVFPECDLCGTETKEPLYLYTSDGERHQVCADCIWKALLRSSNQTAIEE